MYTDNSSTLGKHSFPGLWPWIYKANTPSAWHPELPDFRIQNYSYLQQSAECIKIGLVGEKKSDNLRNLYTSHPLLCSISSDLKNRDNASWRAEGGAKEITMLSFQQKNGQIVQHFAVENDRAKMLTLSITSVSVSLSGPEGNLRKHIAQSSCWLWVTTSCLTWYSNHSKLPQHQIANKTRSPCLHSSWVKTILSLGKAENWLLRILSQSGCQNRTTTTKTPNLATLSCDDGLIITYINVGFCLSR